MKLKLFTVAAAMLAVTISAKAQKAYNAGLITYTATTAAGSAEVKTYFKADSNVTVQQRGPATIKLISAAKGDFFAVLVDVPVASMKKAAVATPAEIEETQAAMPELTFTSSTETKQIAGFNCKKVTAKDAKGTINFDVWVTNDISAPMNIMTSLYPKLNGFPVEFTTYQMGQSIRVTVKSVTEDKYPGTFGIPAGYDRITMSDLAAMSGGKR